MPERALVRILKDQFPDTQFDENASDLRVGSFPEWDSLAHVIPCSVFVDAIAWLPPQCLILDSYARQIQRCIHAASRLEIAIPAFRVCEEAQRLDPPAKALPKLLG